jgi:predicted nucleotidyltransferase
MAQTAKTQQRRLMPTPEALQKALVQSAQQAQRLADAFGLKVPMAPGKTRSPVNKAGRSLGGVTDTAHRTTLSPMRPSEALSLHRNRIREIALSHRVSGVRVFGSALLGKDGPDSDLDLLVEPTAQTTLLDIGAIRYELKKLLGLEVDVLTPNGLPLKFRDQVLREAVPV